MNNIYIQTLKLGFENPDGISLNEAVSKLNIDLSNSNFKVNYTIWFYSNFYHPVVEGYVIGSRVIKGANNRISKTTIETVSNSNSDKSFIKGDAVNKYIDYLELERTRKNSRTAAIYSTISIVIATIAIIISVALSPKQPYEVKIVDDSIKEEISPLVVQPEQLIISNNDSTNN
ncbi:MAG: hypothetical protein HQ541_05270 [Mariniphaga sp.]|nr:hypothetical protein [Mariniphaga sp.]